MGSGILMKTLAIESCLLSLTGLEDIIDIPGTIGGGIIMNTSFRGTGLIKPLIKVNCYISRREYSRINKRRMQIKT